MDRLKEIELFVQVAEMGSLSLASEKLGISNAAGSRFLQALESRLNVRLVERTTRRLWLTDAGREYHQRCTAILSELDDADAEATELASNPKGTLRMTSSVSFAIMHVAPGLAEFRKRFPLLTVKIMASNRYQDFIEAGVDIAIRTREFEVDSSITVRKLAETRRILAASPGYLAARGRPLSPDQIAGHDLLIYNLANDPHVLNFRQGHARQSVRVTGIMDSNEGQVIRAAALEGAGVLAQPLYVIYDDIVAGRLVPVLTDWELPRLSINMAYQSRRHQPAKIRAFTQFLIERFEQLGLERKWNAVF